MKKIGIILITTLALAACTEQEVLAPVTPVTPDGQALIVPNATMSGMEATGDVVSRDNNPAWTMPATRGTTRAVSYPYITTNADGKMTIIVSADENGTSGVPIHTQWFQSPAHVETDPTNSVSRRFEVAQADSLDHVHFISENAGCTTPWRRPTIKEVELIYSMKSQLDMNFADYCYWSSTSKAGDLSQAWYQRYYYDGRHETLALPKATDTNNVRCVRDLTLPLPPRPGTGGSTDGNYPFSIWAYAGTVKPTKWGTSYFTAAVVKSTANGFEMYTPRYYPADGTQKLYFYASAPSHGGTVGGETTEPTAQHFLTDGLKDVMWAKDVRGITKSSNPAQQQQPSFLFQHVLKQVQVKVKIDDTFETGKTLTKLTLKNVAQEAFITLISGTTRFSGVQDIVYTPATPVTLTTTATDAGILMFEPGATFTLEAEVSGVGYSIPVTLTGGTNPGAAGTANIVTLTFKRAGVATNATLTSWSTVQSSDIDIDKDGTN